MPASSFAWLIGVAWVLGWLPCQLQAVTVSTTQGNTSAPADDPGWSNVGILKGSSAVYLGDRWVLTAAHVGAGTVTFPGIGTFAAASGTTVQLTNPAGSGLTKPADLILFQLTADPGLPPVRVTSTSPSVGNEVVVIGNGLAREDDPTYWRVTQRGAVWTWTESSTPSDYEGYQAIGPQIRRWGTNLIEDDETFGNEFDADILTKLRQTTTDTLTLLTEFDQDGSTSDEDVQQGGSSATAFESQAVVNDSGGGMFLKRNDVWELVGTILAVEGHRNQPDVTHHSIYGNVTHYADLASYASQILSRTRYGDFDGNRQLSVADIDLLSQAIHAESEDGRLDLNRDARIDGQDLTIWVEQVAYTYFGDANLDGQFGTADLIQVLQAGEYEDGIVGNSTWATGDWDADRDFTTRDLVAALQSGAFEQGPRAEFVTLTPAVTAVPEPTGGVLWGIALAFLAARRRRFPMPAAGQHATW